MLSTVLSTTKKTSKIKTIAIGALVLAVMVESMILLKKPEDTKTSNFKLILRAQDIISTPLHIVPVAIIAESTEGKDSQPENLQPENLQSMASQPAAIVVSTPTVVNKEASPVVISSKEAEVIQATPEISTKSKVSENAEVSTASVVPKEENAIIVSSQPTEPAKEAQQVSSETTIVPILATGEADITPVSSKPKEETEIIPVSSELKEEIKATEVSNSSPVAGSEVAEDPMERDMAGMKIKMADPEVYFIEKKMFDKCVKAFDLSLKSGFDQELTSKKRTGYYEAASLACKGNIKDSLSKYKETAELK